MNVRKSRKYILETEKNTMCPEQEINIIITVVNNLINFQAKKAVTRNQILTIRKER